MREILLGVVFFFICIAIVRIALKAGRQWNSPQRQYEKQMEDIQRRKRELGIVDEDSEST